MGKSYQIGLPNLYIVLKIDILPSFGQGLEVKETTKYIGLYKGDKTMSEEIKNQVEKIENEGSETRTYSQEEVNALLQAEVDRRITSALKKQEKKNQEKIKEAEKLAQLNEEEKYKYQLEQREKALEEKERKMALMENKAEASNALNSRGISISLADLVVAEDADTMMENIKLLEEEFKKSVKAEVEKRLAGNSPKKNLGNSNEMTREDFRNLSIGQQSRLLEENPKIYEQFL